jgi:hypothetical protein
MEVILQDVSPELLAAFTTFLPGDTQEKKAKLHIASSASSSRMLPPSEQHTTLIYKKLYLPPAIVNILTAITMTRCRKKKDTTHQHSGSTRMYILMMWCSC